MIGLAIKHTRSFHPAEWAGAELLQWQGWDWPGVPGSHSLGAHQCVSSGLTVGDAAGIQDLVDLLDGVTGAAHVGGLALAGGGTGPLEGPRERHPLPACLGISTSLLPITAVMVEKPASRQRVMSLEFALALKVGSAPAL